MAKNRSAVRESLYPELRRVCPAILPLPPTCRLRLMGPLGHMGGRGQTAGRTRGAGGCGGCIGRRGLPRRAIRGPGPKYARFRVRDQNMRDFGSETKMCAISGPRSKKNVRDLESRVFRRSPWRRSNGGRAMKKGKA